MVKEVQIPSQDPPSRLDLGMKLALKAKMPLDRMLVTF